MREMNIMNLNIFLDDSISKVIVLLIFRIVSFPFIILLLNDIHSPDTSIVVKKVVAVIRITSRWSYMR